MDLDNALVMKGLVAQANSGVTQKIIAGFQCNQHVHYLKLILGNL